MRKNVEDEIFKE